MPSIITSAISNVAGKFKENLFPSSAAGNYKNATQDKTALIYPLNLRSQVSRPVIRFTAYERKDKDGGSTLHRIYFPAPPNISFSETANYNSINLGALGGMAQSAIAAGAAAMKAGGGFGAGVQAAGSEITRQAKTLKAGEVAALAAKYSGVVGDDLKGAIGLATGTVVNPNTNTTFEGNSVRSFGFTFKLVARSAAETEVIRKIHNKFRAFSYADSDKNSQNLTLSYPPTWNIDFGNMQLGTDNPYIPKIYACYLTSVQSTFNSTSGAFHQDGAPLEIDISLNYQETRALNRADIIELEETQIGKSRGIDDNGMAIPQRNSVGQAPAAAAPDTNPGSGNTV